MLGVRRTTVTIAAQLLRHIQVLDRAKLEDISCECYAVIRQNADKVFSRPSLGSNLMHPAPGAPEIDCNVPFVGAAGLGREGISQPGPIAFPGIGGHWGERR